jgi:hypothetical protein
MRCCRGPRRRPGRLLRRPRRGAASASTRRRAPASRPSILDEATDSALRRKRASPSRLTWGSGLVEVSDRGLGVGDVGGHVAGQGQDSSRRAGREGRRRSCSPADRGGSRPGSGVPSFAEEFCHPSVPILLSKGYSEKLSLGPFEGKDTGIRASPRPPSPRHLPSRAQRRWRRPAPADRASGAVTVDRLRAGDAHTGSGEESPALLWPH